MKKNILLLTILSTSLHAQDFTITSSNGNSASGNIEISGSVVATYTLIQNSHTSMSNLMFVVGSSGIEVLSETGSSVDNLNPLIVDAANYTFTVTSLAGYTIESTSLSQSVYENGIGNNDEADWQLMWTGSAGTVSDVDNQIVSVAGLIPDYTNGASITTGDKFFTGHITNDLDSWKVTMPTNSFTVDYVSQNTLAHPNVSLVAEHNRESFREWISFSAEISVNPIPEPSTITLIALGALGFIVHRRR